MSPRWARGRADTNHHELVKALKDRGWRVRQTYTVHRFVDAAVYRPDKGVKLVEFKTRTGKPTLAQEQLLAEGWPVTLLRSVADVEAFSTVDQVQALVRR